MARYIDADKMINGYSTTFPYNLDFCDDGDLFEWVESQPTADVVEVRHGEWVYHECVSSYDGLISGYSCSVCSAFVDEEKFDTEEFHKKHCGNCGAKMDGKKVTE